MANKDKTRVQVLRLLGGAAVGAVASITLIAVANPLVDFSQPSVVIGMAAGLMYLLIGLMVGVGMVAPQTGARFLNVEDADELREEGPTLRTGAFTCILIGMFLITLSIADALSQQAAVAITLACLLVIGLVTTIARKHNDELTRAIGREASALAFYLAFALFGGWAALAQLGFAAWVGPLGFVAGLALLQLFAIFAVCARRGLLTPR